MSHSLAPRHENSGFLLARVSANSGRTPTMTMNQAQSRDLIAAAKALTPQIRAVRDELETARKLPESLVQGLAQAGIFKIYYPRSIGGLEADPLTVFHVGVQHMAAHTYNVEGAGQVLLGLMPTGVSW